MMSAKLKVKALLGGGKCNACAYIDYANIGVNVWRGAKCAVGDADGPSVEVVDYA